MHMPAHPESIHVLEPRMVASKQDRKWVVIVPTSASTLRFSSAATRACASSVPPAVGPSAQCSLCVRLIGQNALISSERRGGRASSLSAHHALPLPICPARLIVDLIAGKTYRRPPYTPRRMPTVMPWKRSTACAVSEITRPLQFRY